MREVRSPERRSKHESVDAVELLEPFFGNALAVADISENGSVC
jgi:hypothetical protein